MRVEINDEVGQRVLDPAEVEALVTYVLTGEGAPDDLEVSVSFVGRDEIHRLNREYRGIDRPTDVLSFNIDDPDAWDEDDEADPSYEGDVEAEGDTEAEVEPQAECGPEEGDSAGAEEAEETEDAEETGLGEGPEEAELGEEAGEPLMLGDVIVCPEVVEGQAAGFGNSVADEMRLLLTHGCLHLMGYDHEEPEEAEEMEALERHYLAQFADAPADELNVGPTVDHAAEGSDARAPLRGAALRGPDGDGAR